MTENLLDTARIIGKKIAAREDVIATEIKIKLSDGSVAKYKSHQDPQFYQKAEKYQEQIHTAIDEDEDE